jgi:hypothetical protein
VVPAFCTSHLFSPLGTIVKQLDPACSQLVQKPLALSFQMPTFVLPDCMRGCRVILPSGVKVIVNLVPLGEAALNGRPLKNVAFMSLGAIGCPAKATLAPLTKTTIANDVARIKAPQAGQWGDSETYMRHCRHGGHFHEGLRLI